MCKVVQPLPVPHVMIFSSLHKVSSRPYAVSPHSHPHSWAATILPSVSMDFLALDVSYKWDHTVCGLLCLASFLGILFLRFIDVIEGIGSLFFLFYCSCE